MSGSTNPGLQISSASAQNQTGPTSDDALEERQARIEKLRLEIAALKNSSPWYKPWLEAIPFITVLVTVISLWAGAYKYLEDRKETRLAQQNAQLRTDIDQILSFPSDGKISLARITYLLHNLYSLTAKDGVARDSVTDVIEKLVENDLDFDKLRDASFDVIAMSHWSDYASRLQKGGGSRQLRYKYYQALRHLYEEHKEYFSSIDYNEEAGQFIVEKFTKETQFLRFSQLVGGYQRHVGFIRSAAERRDAIAKFGEALHNPLLAAKLFVR